MAVSLWRRWRTSIILFLAVLGPGFITANVDNDAGGILTYSQAGAHYGYTLLWTMIPITIALIVVQEMCARMGVVTGKGLSDLIREEFGLRITFFMLILLVLVNFGNVVAEFSGIAGSLELFHVSKYISVPVCALFVWALVVKGNYKNVEKVFLAASVFYIAYIVTGVLSGPNWHLAILETVKLPSRAVWHDRDYVYMTVGVIGTTITPWMQFYLQSSIVEKGVGIRQYKRLSPRCDSGLHLHRRRRLVHRRRMCRHTLHPRHARHQRPLRRRQRHDAAGREVRLYPLRRRPL